MANTGKEQDESTFQKDPDEELVIISQNGEKGAFDKLVIKYQDRIFNVMLRMVGEYETALDLTQEVFLRAYQHLPGFRQKASFFTWLFRIALNIATSKRRQYARRPRNFLLSQYESEAKNTDPGEMAPPECEMMQRETQRIVQRAISELPEEFREVLVLRDIEGLSYEEIQEIFQCPLGTVRSRLHRARAILKEKLSPFEL